MYTKKPIFDAVRLMLKRGFTTAEVKALDAAIDEATGTIVVTAPKEAFDRAAFLAQFVNTKAPAITAEDMKRAADRLGVSVKHIEMVRKVESGGTSFDNSGRPIILPEPHIFYRQTGGRFGHTAFSYPKWGQKPYPKSYDARWQVLADMAERDTEAALESASWGLWQVMGFHWKALDYDSALDFARRMAASETEHLEALVRYIEANGLSDELRACRAGSPDSCSAFAKGYNGAGYAKNRYHEKMAEALQ